jgi:hypothetical protein
MITTEFIYSATITVGEIQEIGPTHAGQRRIIPITGGHFEGKNLSGEVLPGGADWQLVRNDGTAYLEARYTMRTNEGALVYVENKGFRHGPADLMARLAAGEILDPDDYYFRTTPVLETTEPSLMWLNRTIFVASGERQADCVKLDVYAVR